MPVPGFVGAGAGLALLTGTGTVSKTGCTAGNMLLVHVLNRGTTRDYSYGNLVNIEKMDGVDNAIGVVAQGRDVGFTGTSKHDLYLGKVMADGTCSDDLTVGASGEDLFARIYEFAGGIAGIQNDGSDTLENDTFVFETDANTGSTITDRNVITNGPNRLAVQLVALDSNQAIGDFAGETGGDWTEAVAEFASASGATGTLQLQIAAMPTAGTIDGGTLTITSAGWGVYALAIIGTPDVSLQVPTNYPPAKFGPF